MSIAFDVKKEDLAQSRVISIDEMSQKETENSVWVKTEKFAFSANNITYAAFGSSMLYWNINPRDDEWGNIPVWGNAVVTKSNRDDIKVAQRLYGVFPMATEAMLNLTSSMPGTFMENSEHRSAVAPVYNRYTILRENQGQMPEDAQDAMIVFQPLFITAYLLASYLGDQECFGAKQVVVTSASSKTAIGLSHYLQSSSADVKVVGLTSEGNKNFVSGLSSYDEAVTYDEIETTLPKQSTVVVDFAGDPALVGRLRSELGDELVKIIGIGATDWQSSEKQLTQQAKDVEFFFAPTHIGQRIKAEGAAEFQKGIAEAWKSLLPEVAKWIEIKRVTGPQDIESAYIEILNNRVKPSEGYVFSF